MTSLNDSLWSPEDPEIITTSGAEMQLICLVPNGDCGSGGGSPDLYSGNDCPVG